MQEAGGCIHVAQRALLQLMGIALGKPTITLTRFMRVKGKVLARISFAIFSFFSSPISSCPICCWVNAPSNTNTARPKLSSARVSRSSCKATDACLSRGTVIDHEHMRVVMRGNGLPEERSSTTPEGAVMLCSPQNEYSQPLP